MLDFDSTNTRKSDRTCEELSLLLCCYIQLIHLIFLLLSYAKGWFTMMLDEKPLLQMKNIVMSAVYKPPSFVNILWTCTIL